MNALFFLVHPSKYHLFKNTFELFNKNGHSYDIIISNKEVLSDLLKSGGYKHHDIFPNGRRIDFLPNKLNAVINLFRTLWRLSKATKNKKYDIFITDDVLTILGRIKRVPSIAFTDNDLSTVPLVKLIFRAATRIIAPATTKLDELEFKKISFKGSKAVAHLHPKYFIKSNEVFKTYSLSGKSIIFIRLSKLNANHDSHGNPGITNNDLFEILKIVSDKFQVIISAEREIPSEFNHLKLKINPIDFDQVLANSAFFIGDSSTMAMEAAVLGVPNILINNIAKKLGVLREMHEKYGIHNYYDTFTSAKEYFIQIINDDAGKYSILEKSKLYINDCDDFNLVLVNEALKLVNNSKK